MRGIQEYTVLKVIKIKTHTVFHFTLCSLVHFSSHQWTYFRVMGWKVKKMRANMALWTGTRKTAYITQIVENGESILIQPNYTRKPSQSLIPNMRYLFLGIVLQFAKTPTQPKNNNASINSRQTQYKPPLIQLPLTPLIFLPSSLFFLGRVSSGCLTLLAAWHSALDESSNGFKGSSKVLLDDPLAHQTRQQHQEQYCQQEKVSTQYTMYNHNMYN